MNTNHTNTINTTRTSISNTHNWIDAPKLNRHHRKVVDCFRKHPGEWMSTIEVTKWLNSQEYNDNETSKHLATVHRLYYRWVERQKRQKDPDHRPLWFYRLRTTPLAESAEMPESEQADRKKPHKRYRNSMKTPDTVMSGMQEALEYLELAHTMFKAALLQVQALNEKEEEASKEAEPTPSLKLDSGVEAAIRALAEALHK